MRYSRDAMPNRELILGVLGRLEGGGVLSPERRRALAEMAEEALATSSGEDGAAAVERTFAEEPIAAPARPPVEEDGRPVPAERPGQYTRLDELGRGGQSVVRRAIDELFGREVALKELMPRPTSAGAGPGAARALRTRFLREARLTGGLDHPGIVAVHELAVRPDGTLFCALKLIRGETLKARIERADDAGAAAGPPPSPHRRLSRRRLRALARGDPPRPQAGEHHGRRVRRDRRRRLGAGQAARRGGAP